MREESLGAQLFLARGARQQNVHQMFLAALARFRRLSRVDRFGHVTSEWYSEAFGSLCDLKICLARQAAIDLKKIRARLRADRPQAGLRRRSRPRRNQAGPDPLSA